MVEYHHTGWSVLTGQFAQLVGYGAVRAAIEQWSIALCSQSNGAATVVHRQPATAACMESL